MFSKKMLVPALAVLALGISAAEFKVDPKVKNPVVKVAPSIKVVDGKFFLNGSTSIKISKEFSGTTTISYTIKQMGKVNPKGDGHFGLYITFANASELAPIYTYGNDWVGIYKAGPKAKGQFFSPTSKASTPLNQPTNVKIVLSKDGLDVFCGKGTSKHFKFDGSKIKKIDFYSYNWKYELSNISIVTK